MNLPLIPADLLKKSDKILFIAHLALGDYTYLQNCFAAFARTYPHLKLHLWVDEVRRTSDAAQWPHLKKNVLYDWLAACDFIDKVYNQNYSPDLFQASIKDAQQERYPIVVALGTLRPHFYAGLAREISPDGFVVGIKKPLGPLDLHRYFTFRKLDASLNPDVADRSSAPHISDVHAEWFRQLANVDIPQARASPSCTSPNATSTARAPSWPNGASTRSSATTASWCSSIPSPRPASAAGRSSAWPN
jgi:hypothetical protein